jgi:hypothetical protein
MSGLQIGPDHQPWDWAVASSASAWASAACKVAQSSSALLEEAADSVVAAGGSVTGAADSASVVFGAGELVVAMVVAAVDVPGASEGVVEAAGDEAPAPDDEADAVPTVVPLLAPEVAQPPSVSAASSAAPANAADRVRVARTDGTPICASVLRFGHSLGPP